MNREPRRVDSEFDKLTEADVSLDDIRRDVEVLWILRVHGDPIHQLVTVGELLGVELVFKL
ncbi:MAG: hypothetical protein KDA69_15060 [Planctomycetaceae bacterium]|nr:hypothetical protein [Planctomycetaceae bacterium]MCA9045645.1 hypothetical protein [Planctomycetaceae bacterium]MCB9950109.1 hypothetical protein [Planctomycetaceae bacterium]